MPNTTGWGYFEQGSDQMLEVDELGSWLSIAINCPVHYPAYGKRLFECYCGVTFMLHIVQTKDKALVNMIHRGDTTDLIT